jgi:tetratricopeptide (TPR) repeat protein
MGRQQRSLDVYRSIVSTQPQNVEALVGAGLAATALNRLDDAADALARAEALAADQPAVLAASAAMHRTAGRSTLALAYYDRALALQPGDDAIREAYDAMRAERAHRVQLDYDYDRFEPFDDELQAGTIDINARLTDALRLFARGQSLRVEGDTGNRAGAGFEWRPHRDLDIAGGVLAGTDTALLPEADGFAAASFRRGRVRWIVDVRYADFDVADLWIGGPGVAVGLGNATITARIRRSRARLDFGDSFTSTSGSIGIDGRVGRRGSVSAEYRYGIDRLDRLTLDRLDADDPHTAAGGVTFDVTPFVTLGAGYEFQSRRDDISAHRGRGRLIFRF